MAEDEMIGWHHWLVDMGLSKLWELVMLLPLLLSRFSRVRLCATP